MKSYPHSRPLSPSLWDTVIVHGEVENKWGIYEETLCCKHLVLLNAIYSAELVEPFNCVQGKEHITFHCTQQVNTHN